MRITINTTLYPKQQKYCPRCKQVKSFTEYNKNPRNAYGLSAYCRACLTVQDKKHQTTRRLRHKHRTYGITPNGYNQLEAAQGYVCAICGLPETRIYKGTPAHLAVDHSHSTGKVRGLLCARCNVALARFQDNPQLFINAAEYLENRKDSH